jgi:hypothetical protein
MRRRLCQAGADAVPVVQVLDVAAVAPAASHASPGSSHVLVLWNWPARAAVASPPREEICYRFLSHLWPTLLIRSRKNCPIEVLQGLRVTPGLLLILGWGDG